MLSCLTSNVLLSSHIQNAHELNTELFLSEFIPCIFGSGVKEDRISTVNILLSTLRTKVRAGSPRAKGSGAALPRWHGLSPELAGTRP